MLGDIDQLVQRRRLVPLGVDEDELLPHLLVADVAIERGQLAERHAGLAGPEERLLSHLDPLGRIPGYAEKPAAVLLASHLREREEHLLLELLILELAIQGAEEGGILRGPVLSQPEDRLLPRGSGTSARSA